MLWCAAPQLSAYAADNGPGQYRVNVSSTLSMRSGPGTNYERLLLIPNGALLTVSETSDGWGKTVYNGAEGWISLDYALFYADYSGNAAVSDQRRDIVRIAQGEVGYKEGRNNYTKYGEWYSSAMKNSPWCAIFVSWCAYQAGISESIIPKFSFCATGIQLFKNLGVWHDKSGYIPQSGDIIFFKGPYAYTISDHVGIVVSCDGTKVHTIEGNSSDAVSERTYDLSDNYIIGYAAPKYIPAPTTTSTTTTTTTASSTVTSAADSTTASSQSGTTTTAATTAAVPSGNIVLTVTGNVVNVRAKADSASSRVTTVRRGTEFESLGAEKDSSGTVWYKISINGKTGYISSKYVSVSAKQSSSAPEADNAEGSGMIVITGTAVNVRSGAGTEYDRIGLVSEGAAFRVTGSADDADGVKWYAIDYNGQTGYVISRYSVISTGVRVTGAVVNVRSAAGTEHTRVGSVRRGQTFELLSSTNVNGLIWYKISWNGQGVYICGSYVQLV